MDVAVVAFVLVALAIGALNGWHLGSREGAGAKHTVEALRLQLDEVVKERDSNRGAAQELAALKPTQQERERKHDSVQLRRTGPANPCHRSADR